MPGGLSKEQSVHGEAASVFIQIPNSLLFTISIVNKHSACPVMGARYVCAQWGRRRREAAHPYGRCASRCCVKGLETGQQGRCRHLFSLSPFAASSRSSACFYSKQPVFLLEAAHSNAHIGIRFGGFGLTSRPLSPDLDGAKTTIRLWCGTCVPGLRPFASVYFLLFVVALMGLCNVRQSV